MTLASLVDSGTSNDVWVDQAQVERSQDGVIVSDSDEQCTVDGWVPLICLQARLAGVSTASTVASAVEDTQRRVCHVKLRDPGNILASLCLSGSNVAVVGSDSLAWSLPLQSNLATGERESSNVTSDSGTAITARVGAGRAVGRLDNIGAGADSVVEPSTVTGAAGSSNARLVEDPQSWEILPHQTSLVAGAGADVWRQESPGPGLRDSNFKPHSHGQETLELAEDHLLTGFGRDGLCQQGGCLARVKVSQEAIDTSLAEPSQLLGEIKELVDVGVWIMVGALLRRLGTEDIAEQSCVANLLLGHEFNQIPVCRVQTSGLEVFRREALQSVLEQV